MKEIIKGPAGLKDPEDMFPKPQNPYEPDPFIVFGDDVTEFFDEGLQQKKYTLKQGDFESMSKALIQKEAGVTLPTDIGSFKKGYTVTGEVGDFDNNSIIDNSMG